MLAKFMGYYLYRAYLVTKDHVERKENQGMKWVANKTTISIAKKNRSWIIMISNTSLTLIYVQMYK